MLDYIQDIFGGVSNIASFMTISVTVMGAVALLLSNLARYLQAKKYGIPIKAVSQATMGDSANIWILLIRAIGFGVILPLVMLTVGWWFWIVGIIAAISFFFALSSTLVSRWVRHKKKELRGKTYIVEIEDTYKYIAALSVLFSFAYLRVRAAYQYVYIDGGTSFAEGFFGHSLFIIGIIGVGLYGLLLAYTFYSGIETTLFGGHECMVVEIEGQKYLVALRNSHYHWILVPCIPEIVVKKRHKDSRLTTENFIRFNKGTFIIRDMSTLNAPIKRMNYFKPVDIGVLEEDVIVGNKELIEGYDELFSKKEESVINETLNDVEDDKAKISKDI